MARQSLYHLFLRTAHRKKIFDDRGGYRESRMDASALEESNSIKEQVSKSFLGTVPFESESKETHKPNKQCQRAFTTEVDRHWAGWGGRVT